MCTFSYYLGKEEIIFTSNRDELQARSAGLSVIHCVTKHGWIFYPLDQGRGGTWIGINEKREVYCLLNGANSMHAPGVYPVSRGSIIIDLLEGHDVLSTNATRGMAPFTLISFRNGKMMKSTFDEHQRFHTQSLDQNSGIFSSSTLYNAHEKQHHQRAFMELLPKTVDASNLFEFHQRTDIRYETQTLERKSELIRTLTTTQFIIRHKVIHIKLRDQVTQIENEYTFDV